MSHQKKLPPRVPKRVKLNLKRREKALDPQPPACDNDCCCEARATLESWADCVVACHGVQPHRTPL